MLLNINTVTKERRSTVLNLPLQLGTNTPAYFALMAVTKKNIFLAVPPDANVMKYFSSALTLEQNKLACLSLSNSSRLV